MPHEQFREFSGKEGRREGVDKVTACMSRTNTWEFLDKGVVNVRSTRGCIWDIHRPLASFSTISTQPAHTLLSTRENSTRIMYSPQRAAASLDAQGRGSWRGTVTIVIRLPVATANFGWGHRQLPGLLSNRMIYNHGGSSQLQVTNILECLSRHCPVTR